MLTCKLRMNVCGKEYRDFLFGEDDLFYTVLIDVRSLRQKWCSHSYDRTLGAVNH